MVENEVSKVEFDENGKRCGYALYKNPKSHISFEGTFLDDKWEGLVIMRDSHKHERKEEEFRGNEDKIGKSTHYVYKK